MGIKHLLVPPPELRAKVYHAGGGPSSNKDMFIGQADDHVINKMGIYRPEIIHIGNDMPSPSSPILREPHPAGTVAEHSQIFWTKVSMILRKHSINRPFIGQSVKIMSSFSTMPYRQACLHDAKGCRKRCPLILCITSYDCVSGKTTQYSHSQ